MCVNFVKFYMVSNRFHVYGLGNFKGITLLLVYVDDILISGDVEFDIT